MLSPLVLCENDLVKIWENQIAVIDSALPCARAEELLKLAQIRFSKGAFRDSHVGRETKPQTEIRSDSIHWIDDSDNAPGLLELRQEWQALRDLFNQTYYLGLSHWEWHFAHYGPGQAYDFHVDQPHIETKLQGERKISFVLYLNPDWKSEHGGRLLFKNEMGVIQAIEPVWNRLILFRSDTVSHSVETSFHARWSLTGWFRRT